MQPLTQNHFLIKQSLHLFQKLSYRIFPQHPVLSYLYFLLQKLPAAIDNTSVLKNAGQIELLLTYKHKIGVLLYKEVHIEIMCPSF